MDLTHLGRPAPLDPGVASSGATLRSVVGLREGLVEAS